jgi:hypothetical protein
MECSSVSHDVWVVNAHKKKLGKKPGIKKIIIKIEIVEW